MDRVKFYSAIDKSAIYFLPKVNIMLNTYQNMSIISINDALEYYNILQFVDAGIFQAECSEDQIKQLRDISRRIMTDLGKYMRK